MRRLNKKLNIRFGIILSYLTLIVQLICTLFISNKVLEFIGDYNYGLYTFVNSITSWLTILSAALSASFVRFSTIELNHNGDTSRTNTIYLKLFIIISIFILSFGLITISILYFNNINIGEYSFGESKLMYLIFIISLLNISISLPTSLFSLYINFKSEFLFLKILSLILIFLEYAIRFLIAFFTKNIIFLTILSPILTILSFVFCWCYSTRKLGIKFRNAKLIENKLLIKNILIFSGFLLFNSIVDQINNSIDKILLGFYSTPMDVTLYQFGQQFSTYLCVMSVSISSVFVPSINDYYINNDFESINNIFLNISKTQIIIMVFVSFGFLSCGKSFVNWWLGSERIDVYYIGATLMILNICPLSINSSIEIQRVQNKHKFRAFSYFMVALLNVILSMLFLFLFDDEIKIFACLLGTVISTIISHWILMNYYNYKVIKLPVNKYLIFLFKYIFLGLSSSFIVFLFRYFIFNNSHHNYSFMIEGIIFVICFIILMLIFDKKYILNILKKFFKKFSSKK